VPAPAATATHRLARARAAFREHFGTEPRAVCDAPGRVNLIGEHIDYAGGSVLPCAIQYGIAIAAGPDDGPGAGTGRLDLAVAPDSPVQPDAAQFGAAQGLAHEVRSRLGPWLGYPAAAPRLCIYSDLPPGAGLSSSAAFEAAVAGALLGAGGRSAGLAGPALTPLALCQLCQAAEQAATGVQCGLMDQYAVVFGRAGCAVHFDTVALTHEYVPLDLPRAALAAIDSGQPRRLAASGYNRRRAELAAGHPLRQRHQATERARVAAALGALRQGDAAALGALLSASHASLRDDFEVSTPELDVLCHLLCAGPAPAAWGARLTGAGFGGSVLALLHPAALEPDAAGRRPVDAVLDEYRRRTGLVPALRLVAPCDGAQLIAGTAQNRPTAGPRLLRECLAGNDAGDGPPAPAGTGGTAG
jgi:galactokinase